MKSYFGYTRVSTAKQGEHGSSLQEQKSAIAAYAERHGLRIEAWFEETETAAKQGRREFNKMLGRLAQGHASGAIIHKIDRSARNLKDWAQLGELIDRGVDIHFAHESVDLQSRGGRLSADIQAVVAADYIRNLREEVRKGFYGRLKQGIYPLGAPIGYCNEGGGKAKSVDPVKGPLVRKLFALYASGRFPIKALRHEIAQRGLCGPANRPLSISAVGKLLRNPFYIGIIRLKKTGEVFAGIHEPLISKTLFDAVQRRLSSRAYPHVVKHGFWLRRLIKCASCGRSLSGERQKGRVYYRCHSVECEGVSLREDMVVDALRQVFSLLTLSHEELDDLRSLGAELASQTAEVAGERKAQKALELGRCQDRLRRLTDAFLEGAIDPDDYNERRGPLLAERMSLQAEDQETPAPEDDLLEKFELGMSAQLGLNSPFEDEKRETVEFLVSNLVAEGKSLVITLHFPFCELANSSSDASSGLGRVGLRTCSCKKQEDALTPGGAHRGRLRTSKVAILMKLIADRSDESLAA